MKKSSKHPAKSRGIFMPWLFLSILSVGMLNSELFAQQKSLNFDLALATFRGNEQFSFVETYLSVPVRYLTFSPEGKAYKIGFSVEIRISKGDSVVFNQRFSHVFSSEFDSTNNPNQVLPAVKRIFLAPDTYAFFIKVADLHSEKNGAVTFSAPIRAITPDTLQLSDIELAVTINRDSVDSQFLKNGYRVLPNPGSLYGSGLPIMFYYAEIYNLSFTGAGDTTSYLVHSRILDGQKQIVKQNPPKTKKKRGNSAVELGRINTASLHSGSYVLELEVIDLATKQKSQEQKKIFIYQPEDVDQRNLASGSGSSQETVAELFPDSRYDGMTEAQIDKEIETTKYIITKEEKNTYKKLDLVGKRQFLKEFWVKRDEDPSTRKNEYREKYLASVEYANKNFGGFQDGWKSDRGRILLLYGEPDEIERSPFSSETKPYQIWKYYSIQGGVEFIFADKRSFGNFELVHSSARGELNDPSWDRWIATD
jgi:GWxTD domain-containing protein